MLKISENGFTFTTRTAEAPKVFLATAAWAKQIVNRPNVHLLGMIATADDRPVHASQIDHDAIGAYITMQLQKPESEGMGFMEVMDVISKNVSQSGLNQFSQTEGRNSIILVPNGVYLVAYRLCNHLEMLINSNTDAYEAYAGHIREMLADVSYYGTATAIARVVAALEQELPEGDSKLVPGVYDLERIVAVHDAGKIMAYAALRIFGKEA